MSHAGLKSAFLMVAVLPGAALAGDWETSNSIRLKTYLTDNVSQRENGSSGAVVSVTPRIGLIGRGARLNGQLSYAPVLHTAFGSDAPGGGINQTLRADLNSTLIKHRLFMDAAASARMVDTSGVANGDGGDIANDRNTRQTYGFSLSPYAQHRFGRDAILLGRVGVDTVQGASGAGAINSTAYSASVTLASGNSFGRLPWSLGASHRATSYDTRDDRRDRVDATLGYRLDRSWRVGGQIGYQNYDVSTSRSSTSGATYAGTLYWTPNPRLSVEAEAGRQYFGTFWRIEVRHQLKRVSWSLDTRREITNTRSAVLLNYTTADFADVLTPEQLAQLDPDQIIALNGTVAEDYLNTSVGGRLSLNGNRTTVTLTGRLQQRDYEITRRVQDITTVRLLVRRQMGGGITGNASLSYQDIQSDLSGDSEYLRYSLGASKSLGRNTRLALDLSRVERTGDNAAVDFTEHRIGLVLTTRMF